MACVVDDDPNVRRVVAGYLNTLGFEVVQAADGRMAIQQLEATRPALLCIDLVLPESSGYAVCEYVRRTEHLKDLAILMISARALPSDLAMAEELGVREYLVKPFSKADFVTHVKRALLGSSPAPPRA
jgi:two-component system chemotaxis response regulator CheY